MKGKFWGDCILLIQNNRITIEISLKQWTWIFWMEFSSYWPYPLVMIIVKSFDPSFGVKRGSDIIPNWNKIHSCKDIIPIRSFYCLREPMIVAALNAINIEMISSLLIYVWNFMRQVCSSSLSGYYSKWNRILLLK